MHGHVHAVGETAAPTFHSLNGDQRWWRANELAARPRAAASLHRANPNPTPNRNPSRTLSCTTPNRTASCGCCWYTQGRRRRWVVCRSIAVSAACSSMTAEEVAAFIRQKKGRKEAVASPAQSAGDRRTVTWPFRRGNRWRIFFFVDSCKPRTTR